MAALELDDLYIDIANTARDDEVTKFIFDPRDAAGGTLTFKKARNGGVKQWYGKIEMIQDTAPGSLWRLCYDNPGTYYPFRVGFGTKTATTNNPHFVGQIRVELMTDMLGNTASLDDGYAVVSGEFKLRGSVSVANPDFVTTGTVLDYDGRV